MIINQKLIGHCTKDPNYRLRFMNLTEWFGDSDATFIRFTQNPTYDTIYFTDSVVLDLRDSVYVMNTAVFIANNLTDSNQTQVKICW